MSVTIYNITCVHCGSIHQTTKPTQTFCSLVCYRQHKQTNPGMSSHKCVNCGLDFRDFGNRKYCSTRCYRTRFLVDRKCRTCGNQILDSRRRFCSVSCRYKTRRILTEQRTCRSCGIPFIVKYPSSRKQTCSNLCTRAIRGTAGKQKQNRVMSRNQDVIVAWRSGNYNGTTAGGKICKPIRSYVLEKFNYACVSCGWNKPHPVTNKIPVEIDHIDGNFLNNSEQNLIVLCPNCHSLTPTYRNLNAGNGRTARFSRNEY